MTRVLVPDYWDFAWPESAGYSARWFASLADADAGRVNFATRHYAVRDLGGCTRQETSYGTPWLVRDAWLYRRDAARGVLEVADYEIKDRWYEKLLFPLSPMQSLIYKPGKEIPWGADEEMDTSKTYDVEMSFPASRHFPPFPGRWSRARQIVWWAMLPEWTDALGRSFRDVLVIQNAQPWGKSDPDDHSSSGSVYYCVRGIGRVGAQWVRYGRDGVTPERVDAPLAAVYAGQITLGARGER